MTTDTTPIYRLEPVARREAAAENVGIYVELIVNGLRDAELTRDNVLEGHRYALNGRLLSVASCLNGTTTDVAVIRVRTQAGGLRDYAVSLATVERITPARG